jgi:hypothetical protein
MKIGDAVRSCSTGPMASSVVYLWSTMESYSPGDNRNPKKFHKEELGFIIDMGHTTRGTLTIQVITTTGNIGWVAANKLEVL